MSELNLFEDDYDKFDSETTKTSPENPLHSIKVNVIKIDPDEKKFEDHKRIDLINEESDIKEVNLDTLSPNIPEISDDKFKIVTLDENEDFFKKPDEEELNLSKLIDSSSLDERKENENYK